MRVREIEAGLWYWTGRHPVWTPADGGPDGWEQEVGCVYYEGPDAVVLFDPLVPMEDPVRFYEALDRDVERVVAQPCEQTIHQHLVVGDELPLEPPLGRVSEWIQQCAAQPFQLREHSEQRHDPWPIRSLARCARDRIGSRP